MYKARDIAADKVKMELSYYYLHNLDTEFDRLMKLADEDCSLLSEPPQKERVEEKRKRKVAHRTPYGTRHQSAFISGTSVFLLIIIRWNAMPEKSQQRPRYLDASVQKAVSRTT